MKLLSGALIALASLSILCGPSIVRGRQERARLADLPEKGVLFFNLRFEHVQGHGKQAVLIPARKYGWSDKYHQRDIKNRHEPLIVTDGGQFQIFGACRTVHYVVQSIDADGVSISADKTSPFKLKWK